MSRKPESGNPSSRNPSSSSVVVSPLTSDPVQNLGAGQDIYGDVSVARPRSAWSDENSGRSSITTPSGGRSPRAPSVDGERLGAAPTIYGEARGLPRQTSRGARGNSVSPAGDGRPLVPARPAGLPRLNITPDITEAQPLAGQGNTGASRGRASSMRIGGLQAASSSTDPVSKGELELYNNIKDYVERQAALEEKQGKYDKTSRIRFRRKARLKQEIDVETTSSQGVFDEIRESFANLSGEESIGALTQYLDEAHQDAVSKESAIVGERDRARNRLPTSDAVVLYYNAKSNILKGLLEKLTKDVSSTSHIHQSVSAAVTNSNNQFIKDKLPRFVDQYAIPQDAVRSVPKSRVVTRGADNYDLPRSGEEDNYDLPQPFGARVAGDEVMVEEEPEAVMPVYVTAEQVRVEARRAAAAKLSSGPDSQKSPLASPPALPSRAMSGLIQSSKDIAQMLEDAIVNDPVRLYTKCKKAAPGNITHGSERFSRTNYAFGNKAFIIDSNAQGPFRVYQYDPATQENKQLLTAEDMNGVTRYIERQVEEVGYLTGSHQEVIGKLSKVGHYATSEESVSKYYFIDIPATQLAANKNLLAGATDGQTGSKIALLKVNNGNVYLMSNVSKVHFQGSYLKISGKQGLLSEAACGEFQKIRAAGLTNMQERAAGFIAERGEVASRQDAAASSASVSAAPPIVSRRQTQVESPVQAAAAASASSDVAPPVPARPKFTLRENPQAQGQDQAPARPATKERTLDFAAEVRAPVVPAKSRALNVLSERSSSASSTGMERDGGGRS